MGNRQGPQLAKAGHPAGGLGSGANATLQRVVNDGTVPERNGN